MQWFDFKLGMKLKGLLLVGLNRYNSVYRKTVVLIVHLKKIPMIEENWTV